MLKDKIKAAKNKAKEYQKSKIKKLPKRKASSFNILLFFNHLVAQTYDMVACHSKDTRKKVGGLIKFLKNNGFTDEEIYDWIRDIVENWERYALKKTTTDRGHEYTINNYPNLKDIIYCKTFFLNADIELNNQGDEGGYIVEW